MVVQFLFQVLFTSRAFSSLQEACKGARHVAPVFFGANARVALATALSVPIYITFNLNPPQLILHEFALWKQRVVILPQDILTINVYLRV